MENNQFTESQLIFLYNDSEFINFISSYFSSYGLENISLSVGANEEREDINWKTYIRILLANINIISDALEKLEKSISFSYEEGQYPLEKLKEGYLLMNMLRIRQWLECPESILV